MTKSFIEEVSEYWIFKPGKHLHIQIHLGSECRSICVGQDNPLRLLLVFLRLLEQKQQNKSTSIDQ